MTIVDEIQFHKVMRERADGRLTSVMVAGNVLVEYKAGEVCHARYGKVFVYASVNAACGFADYYSAALQQPHWLFEIEVDRPSLKHGLNIAEIWQDNYNPHDVEMMIKSFWGNGRHFYYTSPSAYAVWVTDWVIPTRAISIFDHLAPPEGRAINYHDRERVSIGKEHTKIYV